MIKDLLIIGLLIIDIVMLSKFVFPKGVLEVDDSKKHKQRWLFLLTVSNPAEYILNHKYIVMKIKNVSSLVESNESAEKLSTDMRKEDKNEEVND